MAGGNCGANQTVLRTRSGNHHINHGVPVSFLDIEKLTLAPTQPNIARIILNVRSFAPPNADDMTTMGYNSEFSGTTIPSRAPRGSKRLPQRDIESYPFKSSMSTSLGNSMEMEMPMEDLHVADGDIRDRE
jgi:hypothetical protein